MCVETAPEVQNAITDSPIVVTIIPEVHTFWINNRPRAIQYPIGITIHEVSGMVFFTNMKSHQIMMFDTHCPSNLITVAGLLETSGKKDAKAAQFSDPSGISIWNNLLSFAVLSITAYEPSTSTFCLQLKKLSDS